MGFALREWREMTLLVKPPTDWLPGSMGCNLDIMRAILSADYTEFHVKMGQACI